MLKLYGIFWFFLVVILVHKYRNLYYPHNIYIILLCWATLGARLSCAHRLHLVLAHGIVGVDYNPAGNRPRSDRTWSPAGCRPDCNQCRLKLHSPLRGPTTLTSENPTGADRNWVGNWSRSDQTPRPTAVRPNSVSGRTEVSC